MTEEKPDWQKHSEAARTLSRLIEDEIFKLSEVLGGNRDIVMVALALCMYQSAYRLSNHGEAAKSLTKFQTMVDWVGSIAPRNFSRWEETRLVATKGVKAAQNLVQTLSGAPKNETKH